MIIPFVICMLKINDETLTVGIRIALRYVALAIFLAMALSDMIDGLLARKFGQMTRLGSFLDPMADKMLMTCACLLLFSDRAGIEGFHLPPTVVVLIIGKDVLLLLGFIIYYFITFQVRITPVRIGKVATFLQLSMVAMILIAPEMSKLIDGWIWFLRVLWWSAATAAVMATLIYIQKGSRYLEEFEANENHS